MPRKSSHSTLRKRSTTTTFKPDISAPIAQASFEEADPDHQTPGSSDDFSLATAVPGSIGSFPVFGELSRRLRTGSVSSFAGSVTSLSSYSIPGIMDPGSSPAAGGTPGTRTTGVVKFMALPQGEHMKKIGLQYEGGGAEGATGGGGARNKLMELHKSKHLADFVRELCEEWGITNHTEYAIAHDKSHYPVIYVTESNRSRISSGQLLKLVRSPQYEAQEGLKQVVSPDEGEKTAGLLTLCKYAGDSEFAGRLEKMGGLAKLVDMVEKGECDGSQLGHVLTSFLKLMEHSTTLKWDSLNVKFVEQVAAYVANTGDEDVSSCLEPALQILESVVTESDPSILLSIEHDIAPGTLICHVDSRQRNIPTCAVALINALFFKVDGPKKEEYAEVLLSKMSRSRLLAVMAGSVGEAISYQLYVLQHHLLNTIATRLYRCPSDQVITKEIQELRKIAFDSDGGGGGVGGPSANTPPRRVKDPHRDYQKLGFRYPEKPEEELKGTPPGALALDSIAYFARNHYDHYIKVVLENSSRADDHDCPFIRASVELTKLLAVEILQINESPLEEGVSGSTLYYPMLFTSEKPFEELYCICIQLLSKTWKEMKASHQDFNKVLAVLKDQITNALKHQPVSFDAFKGKLGSYQDIVLLRKQQVESKEEGKSQARPIKELREMLKPEIVELIKQHRFLRMTEGSSFMNQNKKARLDREKNQFCRLSPNGKTLHYGNCPEGAKPGIENLLSTINICEIKDLDIGTDKRKKDASTFNILTDAGDTRSFTARSYNDFCMWMDGLNSLLDRPMTSEVHNADLEILLGMEIRLRLLDTEGIDIPDSPPPIPDLPTTMPNGWKADQATRKGSQTALIN